jgi:hypothetical protein
LTANGGQEVGDQKHVWSCKHLILQVLHSILSVIGVLPAWMSTMSFLKSTSGNYHYLVKQNKIGNTQNDANIFLRTVACAINCPIIPVAASKVSKTASKPSAVLSSKSHGSQN